MVVEDLQKSATPTAEENPIGSSSKKQNEVEEGEIIGDENDNRNEEDPSSKKSVDAPHPLEHQWTFWFDNPNAKNKAASWGSSMRSVFTFSTVEEFWSVYNNIHHPSKLGVGADLYCFKKDIEPKWEDPVCANGGKWTITAQKGKSDTYWLYTLLAMIGEQFDYGDEICGAVVNVRGRQGRQERICIWTKNATNEAAQVSIGKQWKEFLDYNESIGFIFHDDAKLDKNPKNKYTT